MENEKRIIIAGSRNYSDYESVKKELDTYIENLTEKPSIITIISGNAEGADKLGERYACENNYLLKLFKANWKAGGHAGFIRNARMADFASLKNGVLFAFWDGKSNGTRHMIDCAKKYKLEIHIIYSTQQE